MPKATLKALLFTFVSLKRLDRRLRQEWDEGSDRKAAIKTAREAYGILIRRGQTIDLEADFWRVSHAAEVLWDSGHMSEAAALVACWRELVDGVCEQQKVPYPYSEPRIWALILSARLEHRRRNYSNAIEYVNLAMIEIRAMAGDSAHLRATLQDDEATALTEIYAAALAIAIPAGRMYFATRPVLRQQMLVSWIADAKLILDREEPPELKRAHALTIQTFYAIAEGPKTEEASIWIEHLIRFDDLLRPKTWRGQVTKSLRKIARARFDENKEDELAAARVARSEMRAMPRHVEVLDSNRWWPKASQL